MRAALLLAALGSAAAASAQGSVVRESQIIDSFGECVLRNHGDRSRDLMATTPGSSEELRVMKSMAKRGDTCIKPASELRMRVGVMRGAVSGAFLRRDEAGLARLEAMAPAAPAPVPAVESDRVQVMLITDCVAAAAPAQSVALIEAGTASGEERAAILVLQPVMAACAPESMTLRLDRHDVRSNIADSLYRRLHGGAPASALPQEKN